MKRIILTLTLLICFFYLNAQQGFQSYADGSPATLIKKTDVEGTELLYENWLPATIKSSNGKEYTNVMVKYNLLEDVPYFLGKGDVTMIFSSPIKEFVIEDKVGAKKRIFRAGFPSYNQFTTSTFFEVLVDGKIKLLKKQGKRITEARAYNSATTVKSIIDDVSYYLHENNQLIAIKRDKKFFLSRPKITEATLTILNDKKVNFRDQDTLIEIVKTFN
ncbi:hypothetical protein [Pedobacter cryotolerans]|uniref:Uncharacterized protein n=1 Tax=Pedobacter cryotolerans TaxID=2571270 RepID=A0A4U1C9K9_9SPHI|nr:hypothetical protein [Pedobacter cryotolerans]TKC03179.1 hypothetical protein FA045_01000 [Pedobacter cryotolerans]